MTRDEITKAVDKFFEWPTEKREVVTLTSCIFFAEYILAESAKNAKPTRPKCASNHGFVHNSMCVECGKDVS